MSIYYYHHTHTHNLRQRLVFGFGSILFWRTTANKIQLILGEYMKANESSLSNSNLTNKLNQSRKIRNAMTLISRLFVCVNVTCGLFFWYNNNLDVWIWLQGTIGSLHLFVYLSDVIDATRREGEKWENSKGGEVIKFSRKKPIGGVMVHLSNVRFYVRLGRFSPLSARSFPWKNVFLIQKQ
jgi:hypothetical protein